VNNIRPARLFKAWLHAAYLFKVLPATALSAKALAFFSKGNIYYEYALAAAAIIIRSFLSIKPL
jgi:hypothetical protein